MQKRLLALPTILITPDNEEPYWLLLRGDANLAYVFAKARRLGGCIHQHGLLRATFVARGLVPIGQKLWSEDCLIEAIGKKQLNGDAQRAMNEGEPFTLSENEINESTCTSGVVQISEMVYADVVPAFNKSVLIEISGHSERDDDLFFTEVPSELVEEVLKRLHFEEET